MSLPFELTPDGWLDGLSSTQKDIIGDFLLAGQSEEEVAELWLSQAGSATTAGFGTTGPLQSFYKNVLREMVAFICDESKYVKERAEAASIWQKHGKIGLVSFVAILVSSQVGLASAAITPVVALIFSSAAKVTKNAFCTTFKGV